MESVPHRPHRRRYTFEDYKSCLHVLAREIERRHPHVRAVLRANSITNLSLSLAPRHHEGYATLLFGIEDLDGKASIGARTLTSPARLTDVLDRFWTVDTYMESLHEMEEINASPAEGRLFRGPTWANSALLPQTFAVSPTDVARLATVDPGAILEGLELWQPGTTVADEPLPGDRAIFAGHWIKVVDASLVEPGRWKVTCTKTLDPRVRVAA